MREELTHGRVRTRGRLRARGCAPHGGPIAGGTRVIVLGDGFAPTYGSST